MIIIRQPSQLRSHLNATLTAGATVGFVPTMGALHQGHISLVREAKKNSSLVVCSIFVNPTQFNDPTDYDKYPSRIDGDIQLLIAACTDILFLPAARDVYPGGTSQLESYDLGYLETVFEGRYRPGHFQGVCQVMSRLLDAVSPHMLFMGQKDYQQCMVIQRLIDLKKMDTRLFMCATQRESDGLAMSSRNLRLSDEQRSTASHVYKALLYAQQHIQPGNTSSLTKQAIRYLEEHHFQVDYFNFANAGDLSTIENWNGNTPLVALVAAFLGEVRLIDNMILNGPQAFVQP